MLASSGSSLIRTKPKNSWFRKSANIFIEISCNDQTFQSLSGGSRSAIHDAIREEIGFSSSAWHLETSKQPQPKLV